MCGGKGVESERARGWFGGSVAMSCLGEAGLLLLEFSMLILSQS